MTRPRRTVAIGLAVVLMAALPAVQGQLGLEGGAVSLGKVDPGHTSTHQRTVTNSGEEAVTLSARVACDCAVYVTVAPERFELGPGQSQALQVQVAVPEDADPGIHDNRVTISPVTERTSGGTGVPAQSFGVTFQVRTAKLYLNPPTGTDTVPARFVNAYEGALDVQINGTLAGQGVAREIAPLSMVAPGSEAGSRTTTIAVPLPFSEDDPPGLYAVRLYSTWANASGGVSGSSGPHEVEVAHGALVSIRSFEAKQSPSGVQMTARLASVAEDPLDTWVVVRLTPVQGGSPSTVESPEVEIQLGEEETIVFDWHAPESGQYTVRAQAAYRTAAGTVAYSSEWPAHQLEALKTAPSGPGSPTPTPDGDGGDDALDPGSPTLLALVALVGLGLGALIAILVNRRGRGS